MKSVFIEGYDNKYELFENGKIFNHAKKQWLTKNSQDRYQFYDPVTQKRIQKRPEPLLKKYFNKIDGSTLRKIPATGLYINKEGEVFTKPYNSTYYAPATVYDKHCKYNKRVLYRNKSFYITECLNTCWGMNISRIDEGSIDITEHLDKTGHNRYYLTPDKRVLAMKKHGRITVHKIHGIGNSKYIRVARENIKITPILLEYGLEKSLEPPTDPNKKFISKIGTVRTYKEWKQTNERFYANLGMALLEDWWERCVKIEEIVEYVE